MQNESNSAAKVHMVPVAGPAETSNVAGKTEQGSDPRILHRTNRLLSSFWRRAMTQFESVDSDSIFFGTDVPYAIYHQSAPAGQRATAQTC